MITVISSKSNLTQIDQLGELRAQIADLNAVADKLAADIKELGAGSHDGELFTATVTKVDEAWSADPKAIAAELKRLMGVEAFERFCAANLKKREGYTSLKLTSRN